MTDSLHDDVKSLLEGGFGDSGILRQILRASEHDEVISNYERKYVRRLVREHLGRGEEDEDDIQPRGGPAARQGGAGDTAATVAAALAAASGRAVDDIADEQSGQSETGAATAAAGSRDPGLGAGSSGGDGDDGRRSSSSSQSSGSKGKVALAAGGAALVALIIAGALLGGTGGNGGGQVPDVVLTVGTDASLYGYADIISISGVSDQGGGVVVSILSPGGQTVWTESIQTGDDGRYSTLAIAGGPGWEDAGAYAIRVQGGPYVSDGGFLFGDVDEDMVREFEGNSVQASSLTRAT